MGQSYFIWNGKDCRSMGVRLSGPAAIIRGEERVQHVTIPGRSGELTLTEGEDIYQSYIQTVTIQVRGWNNVRTVQNWLKGAGTVIFSGEPDRKQKARVIGAVTLNKHSKNMDVWVGECQFYCEPLKEKLQSAKITLTTTGTTVRNDGDVTAKPILRLEANNSVSFSIVTNASGSPEINTFTVECVNEHVYRIDSENMIIIDETTGGNVTKDSSGDFPVLKKGANTVGFSGTGEIEIDKRERFL